MATLRIEHAIHDYDLWLKAFDSFEQARAQAGVRGFAVRRPGFSTSACHSERGLSRLGVESEFLRSRG